MKRILIALSFAAVALLAFSCKNNGEKSDEQATEKPVVEEQATQASQPEEKPIDTLALFDSINGMLKDLNEEKLWSKEIFTPDYYEVCMKLNEFSDGDALWSLGSVQELQSISLTDVSEFKIQDYAHIIAEAQLECKDFTTDMEGTEFRTLSLILRDAKWLIDDVGFSKEDKQEAVSNHEAGIE